jgi:cobalt-zinc-cadmium efflux system outer membrane protein
MLINRLGVLGLMFVGFQGAASAPPRLTLQSALELADKQNLDLVAVRRRRAVALAGIQIARQRPNPTLNFSALRDAPHEGLFFTQPLELGPKRKRRIEVARQEGVLTDTGIAALARQVRRSTREAFYRALLARAETERLRGVLQLAERLKQIAQQRFEAGDVAQLEVIQAALGVARARADYQVAQQRERVSLSQLNALLNEPASTAWELAGSLADPPPETPLAELLRRATQSNPELQRLSQEQKVEQTRRELLKAERIPDLDLELGTDFNSPGDFRVGPRSQLSLTLPLYARNQGQIAQSLASQQVLENETAAAARAVEGRVEAGYFDLQAQQTQVELYRDQLLPVARQAEGLAEESYRAGKVGILAVVEAQRSVQDADRSYLESLFTLQSLFAALEETVGEPLD